MKTEQQLENYLEKMDVKITKNKPWKSDQDPNVKQSGFVAS